MLTQRVWAVYWSATGTTERVVRTVAAGIAKRLCCSCESRDFTLPQSRETTMEFGPGDLVVFGTPTYAGRVPNVLVPFLTEKVRGAGALAVPVVLYGNRNYDDSLMELRNILEEDGFHTIAAGAFIGEHSFSRTLAAGRPDAADLAVAETLAKETARKAAALENFPSQPVPVQGQWPLRPYYTPRDRAGNPVDIRKVKPVVGEACDGCGLCARLCPMGSIDPRDVRNYTGICIKCGACIKNCPKGARTITDERYLYHKTELELGYARRAEPELFL